MTDESTSAVLAGYVAEFRDHIVRVLTVLPREVLASQFQPSKIANATEIVGALRQDRHSGIMGELGMTAPMVPVSLKVRSMVGLIPMFAVERLSESTLKEFPEFGRNVRWFLKNRPDLVKDVIHEAAIKIRGATKAPDYCFRLSGVPKFFLEAKKPAGRLPRE